MQQSEITVGHDNFPAGKLPRSAVLRRQSAMLRGQTANQKSPGTKSMFKIKSSLF